MLGLQLTPHPLNLGSSALLLCLPFLFLGLFLILFPLLQLLL